MAKINKPKYLASQFLAFRIQYLPKETHSNFQKELFEACEEITIEGTMPDGARNVVRALMVHDEQSEQN